MVHSKMVFWRTTFEQAILYAQHSFCSGVETRWQGEGNSSHLFRDRSLIAVGRLQLPVIRRQLRRRERLRFSVSEPAGKARAAVSFGSVFLLRAGARHLSVAFGDGPRVSVGGGGGATRGPQAC